jgi:micrococcal nuclease
LFHRATCKWARPIPRSSRIKFSSRDDAIEAGFRRCDTCNS